MLFGDPKERPFGRLGEVSYGHNAEPKGFKSKIEVRLREGLLIGAPGFEPGASWSQTKRATKLRYAPEKRAEGGSRGATA